MIKWRLCDIGKFVQMLPHDSTSNSAAVSINWTGPEYYLVTDVAALEARVADAEALARAYATQRQLDEATKPLHVRIEQLLADNEWLRDGLRGIAKMDPKTEADRMVLWATDTLSGRAKDLPTPPETKGDQG